MVKQKRAVLTKSMPAATASLVLVCSRGVLALMVIVKMSGKTNEMTSIASGERGPSAMADSSTVPLGNFSVFSQPRMLENST